MKTPWTQPPIVVGANRIGNWMNWVERMIRCLCPIDTPTVSSDWNFKGIRYNAAAAGNGGAPAGMLCMVTELYGTDYIGVTQFNTQTTSMQGQQFYCAKCITGRQPFSELIDGQEIVYDQYMNDIQRRATIFSTQAVEFHSIHPRYIAYNGPVEYQDLAQTMVKVVRLQNPTGVIDPDGNNLYFLEDQPNRYWAWNPALNGNTNPPG